MTATDPALPAPFAPDLLRAMKALFAVSVGTGLVDVLATPHRAVSVAFIAAGLLVGWGLGHTWSRQLADWCEDAPVLHHDAPLAASGVGRAAVLAVTVVAFVALVVPLWFAVPTPLPALCLAAAVQSEQALRALRRMERTRGGVIVRPAGRVFFDEKELRLVARSAADNRRRAAG